MHKTGLVQSNMEFLKLFSKWNCGQFQVIDFKRKNFRFLFQQSIETRAIAGLAACQVGVIHKVIHRFCG
jgi:hypothetical protein